VPGTFPTTLLDFQQMFPNEEACIAHLEELRWPEGFTCPVCDTKGEPFRFANRPTVLRCRACRCNTRVTAGTVMNATRTPLQAWFWAAFLITTQVRGMSALDLQRRVGINRYETAFQMLHKLRAAMVRPGSDKIGGRHIVEVDETVFGGDARDGGRSTHHMTTVVGAVEVPPDTPVGAQREGKRQEHDRGRPVRGEIDAGRLRLRVIPNRGRLALASFVTDNVAQGTMIFTDGWHGYDQLAPLGYKHRSVRPGDGSERADVLPVIHMVFAGLRAWLHKTHRGVCRQHLQAYLNEYAFRFNQHFYSAGMLNSLLGIGTHVESPTYRALYDGKWRHPRL
jgi:transposase-like protein